MVPPVIYFHLYYTTIFCNKYSKRTNNGQNHFYFLFFHSHFSVANKVSLKQFHCLLHFPFSDNNRGYTMRNTFYKRKRLFNIVRNQQATTVRWDRELQHISTLKCNTWVVTKIIFPCYYPITENICLETDGLHYSMRWKSKCLHKRFFYIMNIRN